MAAVGQAISIFASISVTFAHKPVATARDAGAESIAHMSADLACLAGVSARRSALRLDADPEHGAAPSLVAHKGVVDGLAPEPFVAVVATIHITAAGYADKTIAGQAAAALSFAGTGLLGRDAAGGNASIEQTAIRGWAV